MVGRQHFEEMSPTPPHPTPPRLEGGLFFFPPPVKATTSNFFFLPVGPLLRPREILASEPHLGFPPLGLRESSACQIETARSYRLTWSRSGGRVIVCDSAGGGGGDLFVWVFVVGLSSLYSGIGARVQDCPLLRGCWRRLVSGMEGRRLRSSDNRRYDPWNRACKAGLPRSPRMPSVHFGSLVHSEQCGLSNAGTLARARSCA